MEIAIYLTIISAFTGGIIAHIKKDYFSRGFFICLFTSVIGLAAIILSPNSKSKDGDEFDYHNWPKYGSYAVLFILIWFVLILIVSMFI